ncbi:MAG: DUF4861 family protein [Bacteroidales bacterium]|nr:DUF4861 family protein [Bacteroidales bacterium]
MKKLFLTVSILIFAVLSAYGQNTASSLFWKSDSLQVGEIVSERADLFDEVGHNGPALENSHMVLRLYYDDSGAVDVYSKSGRGKELERYLWYPDSLQQAEHGAGADAYVVGETLGLGGVALWDGEEVVRLVATKGRTARRGMTKNGSYMEMVAYGVEYMSGLVDISIRIDVTAKDRNAKVTAHELSGKKVQFVTGVNWHEGQHVSFDESHICVWGTHPSDTTVSSFPVGAGMLYSAKSFPVVEKTVDMVRIISKHTDKVSTSIVAASTKEAELNSLRRFEAYLKK